MQARWPGCHARPPAAAVFPEAAGSQGAQHPGPGAGEEGQGQAEGRGGEVGCGDGLPAGGAAEEGFPSRERATEGRVKAREEQNETRQIRGLVHSVLTKALVGNENVELGCGTVHGSGRCAPRHRVGAPEAPGGLPAPLSPWPASTADSWGQARAEGGLKGACVLQPSVCRPERTRSTSEASALCSAYLPRDGIRGNIYMNF